MTPTQREMARHALGLGGRSNTSYRNRFIVGPGCTNYGVWLEMVEAGDAERCPASPDLGCGRNDLFYLTRQGAEKALDRGEKLDREDFPKPKSGLREKTI